MTGRIFVFTGTSGSGRKTLAHRLAAETGIAHVSACTDRPPRDASRPDRDYHYVSPERFDALSAAGAFVEAVKIDRFRYGVLRSELEYALNAKPGIYLVLNREGADSIKRTYGDRVVRLFVYVDKNTVRERLESKGFPFDVIDRYLDHYTSEVSYRNHCEHVIENLSVDRSVERLKTIVQSYLP